MSPRGTRAVARDGPLPWATALVTGASSGIGAAIAHQLASRGVGRLVLVARRASLLDELAADLHDRWGTVGEVLAADLIDPADRARVEQRLRATDRPVDLLVNNAGIGTAGAFLRLDPDGEEREIDLNVTAVVRLTRAVLPGMVERRVGSVLLVSSMAGNQPSPGMATYSATKAFVTLFSESLHEELRGTGVTTTALLPGYTRTGFQDQVGETDFDDVPAFVWMSAEAVAANAVEAAAAGRPLCIPGAVYRAANALETPLPRSARRWLMGRLSAFDLDRAVD